MKNWYNFLLRYEELLPNFHKCENWFQILTRVKNRYEFLTSVRNWYQIIHMWKMISKTNTCEELVPNPHTCEKLVPNNHRCEELVLNRHRCQWINCEELESNAKCSRTGSILSMWGIRMYATRIYMKFDFLRIFYKVWEIDTKYVTYWYQFYTCCEWLVPILHSVKFTKCEICGSTELYYLNERHFSEISCNTYSEKCHRLIPRYTQHEKQNEKRWIFFRFLIYQ